MDKGEANKSSIDFLFHQQYGERLHKVDHQVRSNHIYIYIYITDENWSDPRPTMVDSEPPSTLKTEGIQFRILVWKEQGALV